jgi:hypothetical protein
VAKINRTYLLFYTWSCISSSGELPLEAAHKNVNLSTGVHLLRFLYGNSVVSLNVKHLPLSSTIDKLINMLCGVCGILSKGLGEEALCASSGK